jgi:hypothetical protein
MSFQSIFSKISRIQNLFRNVVIISGLVIVFLVTILTMYSSNKQEEDIKAHNINEPLYSQDVNSKGLNEEIPFICFDSLGSYKEAYETSKSSTGVDNSIDLTVRSEFVSKLLFVNSAIYGSSSLCNVSGSISDSSSETNNGLLGSLSAQTNDLLIGLPGLRLDTYLAEMLIPGVDTNNVQAEDGYHFLKDTIKLDTYWIVFRDLAYIFFIIVVIIIGFMIMFRKNINGQVQITVMNSIPNVIVGLILVTFSFAIAGFMMDMGRLSIDIIGNKMASSMGAEVITMGSIGDLFLRAMDESAPNWKVETVTAGASYATSTAVLAFEAAGGLGEGTAWVLAINALKLVAEGIKLASWIVLAKYALLGIIAIYASLRIFFTIVMTYMKLFLDVILAPMYMMIGSIPGNSAVIGNWFKRMTAHILVFVIVFGILNFAWMIALSDVMQANLNFFTDGVSADVIPDWLINMKGLILLAGYFLAAGAPGIANEMMKVSSSKAFSQAASSAKGSMKKIPLIGNLAG